MKAAQRKAFASIDSSPKQTNKFGGLEILDFRRVFKNKGKQWSNRVITHVKPWQGNNAAKVPCKICDKLHFGECWNKGKPKCDKCNKLTMLHRLKMLGTYSIQVMTQLQKS